MPPSDWPLYRSLRGELVRNFELHGRNQLTGDEWVAIHNSTPVYDAAGSARVGGRDDPGHHRAQAHGTDAARGGPAQGRIHRHARARVAQSARPDAERHPDAAGGRRRGCHAPAGEGHHRTPGPADGAADRRPARHQPHHARQAVVAARAGRTGCDRRGSDRAGASAHHGGRTPLRTADAARSGARYSATRRAWRRCCRTC